VRTLHADLLAAQKSASREPHVAAVVSNDIGTVRRYDFAQLDATVWPSAKHDAGVTADGAVHRVRVEAGTVKYQRVPNPSVGPWNAWSNMVAGVGSNVAIAARGARVVIVYSDAAGTGIRARESTDSGVTFSADAALFASPFTVADLAAAYLDTAGVLGVAWVTLGTVNAYINLRVSGVWGGATVWPHAAASLTGIALVKGLFWEMVLTGTELTTNKPTVWSVNYSTLWSSLWKQVQGESGLTAFGSPFLEFTDTWRVNYVEAQLFSGGATRLYRAWVHPDAGFAAGDYTWRTPVPVNYANTQGLCITADRTVQTGYAYESGVDLVQRAARDAVALDVSADVLALDIEESTRAMRGTLDLNNADGAYTAPPSPIQLGNRIAIAPGYVTASGVRTSQLADMWIAGYEHRRTGGVAVLRLQLESGWDLLRRSTQRTAVSHTADTYLGIIRSICARAALDFQNTGGSARMSGILPAFTIDPATSGYAALLQAYAFVADRMRMGADGAAVSSEPLAGDATDYTFGTDHPLNVIELRTVPAPVSEAHAFGAGVFGDDLDFAQLAAGIGAIERQRDLTSASGAAADATAAAHRRQRALDADHGRIIVPPNVGLEVLDVVEFTDGLVAAAAVQRRAMGIRWRYDRHRALYQQEVRLGPR
jgi:hypothetical protein